jgi:hypothetical protein
MPRKFTFSAEELSAFKVALVNRGFDAIAKELANLGESSVLDKLKTIFKACDGNSFSPGTSVLMADGSAKPIRDVRTGDRVVATDPLGTTTVIGSVREQHLNRDVDLADLLVTGPSGRQARIETTEHHQFWNQTAQQWAEVADLRPGDLLRTPDGADVRVSAVQPRPGVRTMYDLTVGDVHTYYVFAGADPVLVHNNNCGGPLFRGTTPGYGGSNGTQPRSSPPIPSSTAPARCRSPPPNHCAASNGTRATSPPRPRSGWS